jgi:hypothetical protein
MSAAASSPRGIIMKPASGAAIAESVTMCSRVWGESRAGVNHLIVCIPPTVRLFRPSCVVGRGCRGDRR